MTERSQSTKEREVDEPIGPLATTAPAPAPAAPASSSPPLGPGPGPDPNPDQHLPLTPPHSPRASRDDKSPSSSHQQYLDSLPLPSGEEFVRLADLQEERHREHKQHERHLRRLSMKQEHKQQEAHRDFAEARHRHIMHTLRGHARASSDGSPAQKHNDVEGRTDLELKAATLIQRTYRGHRTRREIRGLGLNADTRWTHAIRDAQWKNVNTPRPRASGDGSRPTSNSSNVARQNWKKVATVARRAGVDEDSSHSSEDDESDSSPDDHAAMTDEQKAAARRRREKLRETRRKHSKPMGLQYFLEMVDIKHRYGSNLRQYHEQWKKSDTKENYFYWLDYGEGRNIELPTCPRERLEREQVRYLSREERQHYLVKVDPEGRLVWAKNGIRIDTTDQWKDSIHGIVPVDDKTPAFRQTLENQGESQTQQASKPHVPGNANHTGPTSESSEASESELEADRAAKYATPGLDESKGMKKVKHVSAATIFNKLLRKSVKKGTWIFVADTSHRLYVGIKSSGAFQHSSFLQGARILAAGLIKVKNGRLSSLSPLSGHYRPPASNFRAFVHSLKDEGVDMSHVSISKSYAVLVGLEAYVKSRTKGKEAVQRLTHHKQKLLDPVGAQEKEEAARDKSESAAKERRFLEKQQQDERERDGGNRAPARLVQKLRERMGSGSGGSKP